jgi:hypothetical protein
MTAPPDVQAGGLTLQFRKPRLRKAAPVDAFVCTDCGIVVAHPRTGTKPETHECGGTLRQLGVKRYRCSTCQHTTEGVNVDGTLVPLRQHPPCKSPRLARTEDPVMVPDGSDQRRVIEIAARQLASRWPLVDVPTGTRRKVVVTDGTA